MPLTLTDKEKKSVLAQMAKLHDAHMKHFPYARYPVEPLEKWRTIFCDPIQVTDAILKEALSWQFGSWQRKDMTIDQRKTLAIILRDWAEYTSLPKPDVSRIFDFWNAKIPCWLQGFDAVAFLLHLQFPDQIELTDHHRIEAMFDLLKTISHSVKDRVSNLSMTDMLDYTAFLRCISPKSDLNHDRFLKVYGNRHAFKNIPSEYVTKEASIRSFSWDNLSSTMFNVSQIINRSNADILFACLLLTLERNKKSHENLTIGEVVDLLPLGTAGICNPASFNYALISLFSGQKQRDFWRFQHPELQAAFTDQANNSTRNMQFYQLHSHEVVSVSSKYVLQEDGDKA